MNDDPRLLRVEQRFERRRAPSVIAALLGAFLLIAITKPWSLGGDGPATDRSATRVPIGSNGAAAAGIMPSPSASPSPIETPTVPDPNAMACLTDDTEQIVLFERWAGNEVRSWVASRDGIVPGPLDPALLPVPIFSSHVIGLGVCAPRSAVLGGRPAAHLLDIRAIVQTDAGPRAVDLGGSVPITARASGPEPAVLYGPPTTRRPGESPSMQTPSLTVASAPPHGSPGGSPAPSTSEASPFWATGSYAIGFRFDSDDPSLLRWLRIDLLRGSGAAN
jgi:hypothetical protein